MKRAIKRWCMIGLCLVLMVPMLALPCFAQRQQAYSYVYDSHGNAVESPTPYQMSYRIDTSDYGIGVLRSASGLFVRGDMLYICDNGNNRIVELRLKESEAELVRVIDTVGSGSALSSPTDIFVTEDGKLVIADTGNNRIVCTDEKLRVLTEIFRPDDPTVDQTIPFRPNKLAVAAGHIYVQAQSINKGLMEFTLDGEFVGFMGASPVKFDWADYFWKSIATDTQRQAMTAFVPTEYNNVAVDSEGFLFVTNATFSASELRSGKAVPIRRLNLKGSNILIQNGNHKVIGDVKWTSGFTSRFTDITAMDDGTYYALDTSYSRVFAYDDQGNMLYAFGGIGTKAGYFTTPAAIEHHGQELIILDSASSLVTVMRHTQYGELISNAIAAYSAGEYDQSKAYWEQVLQYNGSYELAYRGIGKVLLRNGDYKEALNYLKYAKDEYYYSKAWQLYRKAWIEDNIVFIVVILGAAVAAWVLYGLITKIKGKVDNYVLWHSTNDG